MKAVKKHGSVLKEKNNLNQYINGDLLRLIGCAPCIVPKLNGVRLTQKSSWSYSEFVSDARQDGLKLSHWVKVDESLEKERYKFDAYNKQVDMVQYSNDEYDKYLVDLEWDKDETDYLMELCKKYDLRFIVIHDNYNFQEKQRTIEDLKERYYFVTRKMMEISRQYDSKSVSLYQFDKERETQRKANLLNLLRRSEKEWKEEEYLYYEAKRIEQQEKRMAKERKLIFKLLNEPDINQFVISSVSRPKPSQPSHDHHHSESIKKKKSITASKPPATPSQSTLPNTSSSPLIERVEGISKGSSVSLRSSKIPLVRPGQKARFDAIMGELGLDLFPHMPTRRVCEEFERVATGVLRLMDTKKQCEKLEQEARSLMSKKTLVSSGKQMPNVANTSDTSSLGNSSEKKRAFTSPLARDNKRARKNT